MMALQNIVLIMSLNECWVPKDALVLSRGDNRLTDVDFYYFLIEQLEKIIHPHESTCCNWRSGTYLYRVFIVKQIWIEDYRKGIEYT